MIGTITAAAELTVILSPRCYKKAYQQQAEGEVTEDDFHHWLAGLPEKMRVAMARDGFEASKNSLPLRRHALERRALGHDAFLQTILSPED